MKNKITKRQRICGIILGLGLTVLMFSLSMSAVILNGDFWLKQNDKYNYAQSFNFVSNDDYNSLYHNYIELLKNKQSADKEFTVTLQSDPKEFVNTFIELETEAENKNKITKSVSLTKEYLETVTRLSQTKGETIKDAMRFQFAFKPVNEEKPVETILKVSEVLVFDSQDNNYEYTLKKYFYNEHGNFVAMDIEDPENIEFNTSNFLGVVILGEIKDNISVQLNVSTELKDYNLESVFTYKEMLTNDQVAKKVGYEANIVTFEERNALFNVGTINIIQKTAAIIFCILTVVLAVLTIIKEKRISLLGIGFYAFLSIIVFTVIINIIAAFTPSEWGFSLVLNLDPLSTTGTVLGKNFMEDFAKGSIRYFDFTVIFPLFASYLLTKLSKKNKEDPNEDYLYQ